MNADMIGSDIALSAEEMAATLAHEVKNPLSLVRANLDLLELDDGGLHKNNYRVMKRELDRVNDIVMELIELTAVTPPEGNGTADLPAVLEELLKCLHTSYPSICFEMNVAAGLTVRAHPRQLRLILNNIVKNAVEAVAAESSPRIAVSADTLENEGCAVLRVSDNGRGFSQEEAAVMMLTRYTTKQGGSGLGLYASKSIAAQLGGSLDISGVPGGGCTVEIKLPM